MTRAVDAVTDPPRCWVGWTPALPPESLDHLLSGAERSRLNGITNPGTASRFVTARALLRVELSRWAEIPLEQVVLSARCPSCGRDDHGRLTARTRQGEPLPHVSLTRGSDVVAVALSSVGEVGIDMETVGSAGFAGFDDVALHPAESARTSLDRAQIWVRKEALLKATGDGLSVDPRTVRLSAAGTPPRLLEWIDRVLTEKVWMVDLAPTDRHVGCVCVVGSAQPVVTVREEALEAMARTATRRRGPQGRLPTELLPDR